MSTPHDSPENPYVAPQSELATSKPRTVYERKFNGWLAFWSGTAISVVLIFLALPTVRGPRSNPPSADIYISVTLIVTAVGYAIGLLLGAISGKLIKNSSPNASAAPRPDEPKQ